MVVTVAGSGGPTAGKPHTTASGTNATSAHARMIRPALVALCSCS